MIDYRQPEYYTGEVRSQFEIMDRVKVNTLFTLENVKDYYEVRLHADGYISVFNTKRERYVKPHISEYFRYGLRTVDNKSKTTYMHRLVGLGWIDGWDINKLIDHKDTDKLQSNIKNLEWVTPKINVHRAFKYGLMKGRPRVINIPKVKMTKLQISESSSKGRKGLTYEQVEKVFELAEIGFPEAWIAKQFNVTQPAINQILNGKRWSSHPAYIEYMERLQVVQ